MINGWEGTAGQMGVTHPPMVDRVIQITQSEQAFTNPEVSMLRVALDKLCLRCESGSVSTSAEDEAGVVSLLEQIVQPVP